MNIEKYTRQINQWTRYLKTNPFCLGIVQVNVLSLREKEEFHVPSSPILYCNNRQFIIITLSLNLDLKKSIS